MMTATELAWAAGFFEGEGTVTLRPLRGVTHTPGDLRVAVTQNGGDEARALLERFAEAVGFTGNINGPYDYAGRYEDSPTKKPRFTLQAYGSRAVCVMDKLIPFMSGPKAARYAELSSLIGTGEVERGNTPSTSKYPARRQSS